MNRSHGRARSLRTYRIPQQPGPTVTSYAYGMVHTRFGWRPNHKMIRALAMRFTLRVWLPARDTKDIDGVYIGTAEGRRARRLAWNLASVAQYVDVGKRHMGGHRAQLSALGIKVVAVSYAMPAMAGRWTQTIDQLDGYAWSAAHRVSLLR